jgi:dsRNA-specific ribonuclease
MAVEINGERYGIGTGGSKKEAEQVAAKMALSKL